METFSPDTIKDKKREQAENIAKRLVVYINISLRDRYKEGENSYSIPLTNLSSEDKPLDDKYVNDDVLDVLKEKYGTCWDIEIDKEPSRDGFSTINLKMIVKSSDENDLNILDTDVVSFDMMKQTSEKEDETAEALFKHVEKEIRKAEEKGRNENVYYIPLQGQERLKEDDITFRVISKLRDRFPDYTIHDEKKYSVRGFERLLSVKYDPVEDSVDAPAGESFKFQGKPYNTSSDAGEKKSTFDSNKVFTPDMATSLSNEEQESFEKLIKFVKDEIRETFKDGKAEIRWSSHASLPVHPKYANNKRVVDAIIEEFSEHWDVEPIKRESPTGTVTDSLIFTGKNKKE